MKKLAMVGLALGLILGGTAGHDAFAAAVGGSCAADLQRLCPNVTGGKLKHCRNANRANFSTACTQSLAANHMKLKDLK
jgi:hypothetical protein